MAKYIFNQTNKAICIKIAKGIWKGTMFLFNKTCLYTIRLGIFGVTQTSKQLAALNK